MPSLDFKEIPPAKADKGKPGQQDTFELFAREVLELIGFKIITAPDRGADGGKDLIVEESRIGVGGETNIRWLVSCKHNAHSGSSVNPADETNINDRLATHGCAAFLGFYSTIPSSGLSATINALSESQVYDRERIERYLLRSSEGLEIVRRFFPASYKKWRSDPNRAADVMFKAPDLVCMHSGANLLVPEPRGIVVLVTDPSKTEYETFVVDVYWCLKGEPDRILEHRALAKGFYTQWEDIPDIIIPRFYLKWCLSLANQLRGGWGYSDEAFEKIKRFLIALYPYAARDVSDAERVRAESLLEFGIM
jgi:hypothetical protein